MPLPDANKKSPRVYTNLQNKDLDNVTFANIQATGNPINVEEANEDELRRLVLVNLARLVTAGEWTGLLEAGGGGAFSPSPIIAQAYSSSANESLMSNSLGWGTTSNTASSGSALSGNYTLYRPFIATNTGTVNSVSAWVGTAAAGEVVEFGIWASDEDTGLPTGDPLTKADLALDSTGEVTQSSLTGSASLTRGTQYYFGYVPDTSSTSGRILSFEYEYSRPLGAMGQNPIQPRTMFYDNQSTANQLDGTFTTSAGDLVTVLYDVPGFSVTFA